MSLFAIANKGDNYPMLHLDYVEAESREEALELWEADEISDGYLPLWIVRVREDGESVAPIEVLPPPAPVPITTRFGGHITEVTA